MAQLTYNANLRPPFPGFAQGEGYNLHGFNTQAAMASGVAIVDDSVANGERAIIAPTALLLTVLGITLFQHTDSSDLDNDDIYAADSVVPYRRRGLVWVQVEETVAVGDQVFFRHANAGAGEALGAFRNDNDGGDATALTIAAAGLAGRWVTGGTAATAALLEVWTG